MTDVPRRLRPRAPQRNNTIRHTRGASSAQGSTSAARPVRASRTVRRFIPPSIGPVQVGDTSAAVAGGTTGVAITSTSDASLIAPPYAARAGIRGVSLGDNSFADGTASVAVGPASESHADYCTSVGVQAKCTDTESVAVGFDAQSYGQACTTIGFGAQTGTALAPVANATAVGAGAIASADDELALGSGSAIAIVKGKLVIADGSGGLHQIVVSTGGALSTVAYP